MLALVVVFAALTVFAVMRGQEWYRTQQQEAYRVTEVSAKERANYQTNLARLRQTGKPPENQDDLGDPSLIGYWGHTVYLAPLPTAALAIGAADHFAHEAKVSSETTEADLWSHTRIDNPLLTRSGRFDLAFVMTAILPLLLLAVSYNVLSADREQGTLALLLTQTASPLRLAWGRLVVRGGLMLGFAVGVALASLAVVGVPLLSGAVSPAILLWMALVVAYGGFWLALALWVNTLRTSSAVNALILAGVWTMVVVLLPATLNLLLISLHPPPSRAALTAGLRTASREARAEEAQALAEFYFDHPELRPAAQATNTVDRAAIQFAMRQRVALEVEPLLREFDRQLERQRAVVNWAQYLAPAVLVSEAFGEIAGTGGARQRRFRAVVTNGLRSWHDWFQTRQIKNQRLTDADLQDVPWVQLPPDSIQESAPRLARALCGLALPGVIFAGLASARLRGNRLSILS